MEDAILGNGVPQQTPASQVTGAGRDVSREPLPQAQEESLSQFPFLNVDENESGNGTLEAGYTNGGPSHQSPARRAGRSLAEAMQTTRRRRGSLRKAALLGRGAQREKKELKAPPIQIDQDDEYGRRIPITTSPDEMTPRPPYGLGITDLSPRTPNEGYGSRNNSNSDIVLPPIKTLSMGGTDDESINPSVTSPTLTYTSTTDEEDILSIRALNHSIPRGITSNPTGPDSFFQSPGGSLARRRSSQRAKSPLSIAGLASSALPQPDQEWDYSATEWWGWVVLIVTWVVFVIGMGSCLGVWSWAWDVGETPYAPPELEDDPTLPIVGYYPALIILTAIMAWVWVVVAWVGMKYFRHAKISGD